MLRIPSMNPMDSLFISYMSRIPSKKNRLLDTPLISLLKIRSRHLPLPGFLLESTALYPEPQLRLHFFCLENVFARPSCFSHCFAFFESRLIRDLSVFRSRIHSGIRNRKKLFKAGFSVSWQNCTARRIEKTGLVKQTGLVSEAIPLSCYGREQRF